jgi:molybdopterin biosynthesis enzyme
MAASASQSIPREAGAAAQADLGPGEAIAISTGAMGPAGADAIVRLEKHGGRNDYHRED